MRTGNACRGDVMTLGACSMLAGSFVLLAVVSCQRPTEGVVVAPNVDRHPPPQSADGQVIGADRRSPERTLAEGATTDHLAPGWKADEHGLEYDLKRDPAGSDPGSTRLERRDGGAEVVPSREK
jgi:hypothetical protein